jgi:hypothetical protein
MPLDAALLQTLTNCPANEAWGILLEGVKKTFSKSPAQTDVAGEIAQRDRETGTLDHFLSSVAWDLWREFGQSVEKTSCNLKKWWSELFDAKAILILDGMSLRELPLFLQGAEAHGFSASVVSVYASELPGDTNGFARALGYSSRSQLQNNEGRSEHFPDAHTESVNLPWRDCAGLIDSSKNWIFWHHWPDVIIHENSSAGSGLENVLRDAEMVFGSEDFWGFAAKLAHGRRLVVTSDHGYAFTGHFTDADDTTGKFLKEKFSSGRETPGIGDTGPFIPPVALQTDGITGPHMMVLGRRKWKSQGGYPVLTHGGLSLLEVLSPFVELRKIETA